MIFGNEVLEIQCKCELPECKVQRSDGSWSNGCWEIWWKGTICKRIWIQTFLDGRKPTWHEHLIEESSAVSK